MKKITLVAALTALFALNAQGSEWQKLDNAAIEAALSDKDVVYSTGESQSFGKFGSTSYVQGGRPSFGKWRAQGNQYCSQWPPSDSWDCYDLDRSADGTELRWTAGEEVWLATYR